MPRRDRFKVAGVYESGMEEMDGVVAEVIVPIICEGDAIGSVALFSRDQRTKMGDTELKLAQTAAGFLGRQMEN